MSNTASTNINIPRHVAIIMDGNGRWAKQRGKSRIAGHKEGVRRLQDVLEIANEYQIKIISLFAFSSENWRRPKAEVKELMKLFLHFLENELSQLIKYNVQLRVIGDLSRFSKKLQQRIGEAMDMSKHHTGPKLIVAASYGGQWDITQAAKRIAIQLKQGSIKEEDIDEQLFSQYLSFSDLPDPDLFIRTSGEIRISNFFLWQLAYTELYFTDIHWPDFDKEAFKKALNIYAERCRRFGLSQEQLRTSRV